MSEKVKKEVARILLVLGTNRLSHSFMFAVYSVFLLSRGLNLFQIAMINLVYHVTIPILEAPTGAIADIIGRKRSYLLANALEVVGFLTYALAHTFVGFAAAEFILAVAYTFASGCTDAHLWETVALHAEDEGQSTVESLGLNRNAQLLKEGVVRVSGAVGGAIGPGIAAINLALPWFASALGVVFSSVFAYKLLANDKQTEVPKGSHKLVWPTMKRALAQILSSDELRRQLVLSFLAGMAMMPLFMYWSPYIKGLASGNGWSGLSFAWILIEGSVFAGAFLSKKLAKTKSDQRITLLGTYTTAVAVVILALSKQYHLALGALLVAEAGNSCSAQSMTMGRQAGINGVSLPGEESVRATILSILSMAAEVGVVISLVVGGLLSQNYGISVAWFASAAVLGLSAVTQYSWKERV